MPGFLIAFDKTKRFFDGAHQVALFLCKFFLIADILITCYVVVSRYVSFIPAVPWSEEVILSLMSYMAVLSAAIAVRKGLHIRMTALDVYLPKKLVKVSDVLSDLAVMAFGLLMLVVGWKYATTLGSRGTYVSMPTVSRFWMYFPIPLAGFATILFQIEVLLHDIKKFFIKEEVAK
jgi:TRAP-type C4-dicarboxylate transport system permease small subunit